MQRVSKKAIWMWATNNFANKIGIAVAIFWFITGVLFIYFAPQKNLGNVSGTFLTFNLVTVYDYVLLIDKWLFLGFSVIILFLIFAATSGAFYKYWSLSYELGDTAVKVVKGFYEKKESYIPYKNIQSVDVQMGVGERFWGLTTVLVYTSGAGDRTNPELAEGHIEGLKYDDAVVLKDELLKRIK